MFGILIALDVIPVGRPRPVDTDTDLNRLILVVASSAVGLLGVGMLFISVRGIDPMAIAEAGVVLPIRSVGGMLSGKKKVIPFDRIVEATAIPAARNRTVVEFVIIDRNRRKKKIGYTIDWADNPEEFERLLSTRVAFRRARSHWEHIAASDRKLRAK